MNPLYKLLAHKCIHSENNLMPSDLSCSDRSVTLCNSSSSVAFPAMRPVLAGHTSACKQPTGAMHAGGAASGQEPCDPEEEQPLASGL